MQNISVNLYQIIRSTQRDLTPVDCFEFYAPDVVNLIPGNAEKRFSSTALVWYGWQYQQQAISRGDISRYMTEKFNSVNITLSNVDRQVSDWLSSITLEGYRVVIRAVSRSIDDESIVLFVGRCEKPGDIENAQISLTAKQDLGSIENEIPFAKYDLKCPLKFKGSECLGGQAIGDKTQTYTTATNCNKSWSQCFEYGNQKAFQGFRYRAIIGSFKVNSRTTGTASMVGSRRATKQWTSTDNVPIGQSIPMGLGRSQIDLTPVLYSDTGEYLYGHFIAGEGPITEFADVRNTTAGWATTFQSKSEHLGEFGYDANQETDNPLLGNEHYSHRAYVEATIKGDNPDTGDPAPTLASVVLWPKVPTLARGCFDDTDWSDNPVEHVRHLLTSDRGLKYPESWIADDVAVDTAEYCNQPLIDTSGCEEFWYDQNQTNAGTDWKRYRSTGVLDWPYFAQKVNPSYGRPQKRGAEYNAYDPDNPPINPIATTVFRKRYTSNWHLKEPVKVADFLFKHLLPSFRGYLTTGADGKLQIKSERPAISSYLRSAVSAGATSIPVEDVTVWQNLRINEVFALIGAGQSTSETHIVSGMAYATNGASLTLLVIQGASAYSATFTSGTTAAPAWNYFTVTGATGGTPVIIAVDGIEITGGGYDGAGIPPPNNDCVAGEMAARINASPTLSRYIEAIWTPATGARVFLRSKLGSLTLIQPLEYDHAITEKAVQVNAAFSDKSFGLLDKSNIIKNSFKWPLGNKQSSYNQFAITYTDAVQDFQQTELRENDYDHQDRVNKVNKLDLSGACVDNYHQADRLVQAARYKYRDGDFFCSFETTGTALLLEEGDIVCLNHANMIGRRNQLFRIEELRVTQDHRVAIVARLYADEQFPDAAQVRTLGRNVGTVWTTKAPPAVTNVAITYTTINSGRITFTFGSAYIGRQTARVEIDRGNTGTFSPLAVVEPDAAGVGAFEVVSLVPNTRIRVTPISAAGVVGASSTLTGVSPVYQWPTSLPTVDGQVIAGNTSGVLFWTAQTGGSGGGVMGIAYAWFIS